MIKQSWDNLVISNNGSEEYSGLYYIVTDATEEELLLKKSWFPQYSEMWDMLLTKLKPWPDPEVSVDAVVSGMSLMGLVNVYMRVSGSVEYPDADLFETPIYILKENTLVCETYMGSGTIGAITIHGKDYFLDGYGDAQAHDLPEGYKNYRKQLLSEQCGSEITKEEIDMIINAIKQYYEL